MFSNNSKRYMKHFTKLNYLEKNPMIMMQGPSQNEFANLNVLSQWQKKKKVAIVSLQWNNEVGKYLSLRPVSPLSLPSLSVVVTGTRSGLHYGSGWTEWAVVDNYWNCRSQGWLSALYSVPLALVLSLTLTNLHTPTGVMLGTVRELWE